MNKQSNRNQPNSTSKNDDSHCKLTRKRKDHFYDDSVDFAPVPGCARIVAEGFYNLCFTPKIAHTPWEQSLESAKTFLEQEEQVQGSILDCSPRIPDWDEGDWRIFETLRNPDHDFFFHYPDAILFDKEDVVA